MNVFVTAALLFAAVLPTKNFTVTSVPTIATVTFKNPTAAIVIGIDGVARTCPDSKGVSPYVRVEGPKSGTNAFQYVTPGSIIRSGPQMSFTLACLKIE